MSPGSFAKKLKETSDDELDAKLLKMEKRGSLLGDNRHGGGQHGLVDWTPLAQELSGLLGHRKVIF